MPIFMDYSNFGGPLGDPPGGLPGSRVGIAETFPRMLAIGDAPFGATANWNATAIYLPAGLIIQGITFFSGGQALGTGVHQWFGIWDKNLALLGGSADDTSTAWAANTAKRLALTTPKRTTYAGLYYVGGLVTATTVPTVASIGIFGGAATNGLVMRGLTPAIRVVDNTTVDTALAPTLTQVASSTATNPPFYAVLD